MKKCVVIKKFTLIELLVVIAIIGILAGMIMPVLNSAREKGKQASCTSNQRQVMIRILMYSIDNNGFMMPSGRIDSKGKFINQQYSMFLDDNAYAEKGKGSINQCPSDPGLKFDGEQWPTSNYVILSPELTNKNSQITADPAGQVSSRI